VGKIVRRQTGMLLGRRGTGYKPSMGRENRRDEKAMSRLSQLSREKQFLIVLERPQTRLK